jgi:hypothetical protein
MTTKTVSKMPTPELKSIAMTAAAGKKTTVPYTDVIRTLASRLKADPKKIRRQARDQFWKH